MSGPIVLALRALLAVSLYAFLAWAFFSLWREITQQGALLASRRVPPISLTVTHDDSSCATRHFIQAAITIGRDPACEYVLDDDSVSARHARLSYHHNQWWLEDLGSKNGTLLNNQKLDMPTVVISNDEFICGETCFTITLSGANLRAPKKASGEHEPDSLTNRSSGGNHA
jgi:predicted component of type VI protein secretion system